MPAKKKTSKAKKAATAAPKAKKAATSAAASKAKKAPAKKAATKKAPAKKAAAKKAPAKKTAAKKTAAKKAPAKKAGAKKAAAKKTATAASKLEKTTTKKAAAKNTATAEQAPAAAKPSKAAKKIATAEPAPTPSSGSDHDAAIARIEAKAAAAGVPLAKGASAAAIKAAEKALGAKLPEEVVAFYRRHDGAEDDPAVEGRELLSLSRMVDEWKIWKDLFDQGTFEANDHGRPDPGVQQKWWIPEWVPVTYDGAGNHHVIDLAPAEGGIRGQILSFWHDDDPRTVVAKDFLTWLEATTWGDSEHEAEAHGDEHDEAVDEDEDGDDDEAAAGGFQRFEMDQKFWEIRLDGDSFTVRFGKLGTDGQEQIKSFDDEATARKEHDKLVASKVKKGYQEV